MPATNFKGQRNTPQTTINTLLPTLPAGFPNLLGNQSMESQSTPYIGSFFTQDILTYIQRS